MSELPGPSEVSEPSELSERIVAALRGRGWSIATGESLTAGMVASTLAEVPGCSDVLRGGVIAYQVDVKESVLGVSDRAIAQGVVSEQVALELAHGAARTLGARVGVGTTGAAGPQPHDGAPAGTVWVAVWVHGGPGGADQVRSRQLHASGDRAQVRAAATQSALEEVWAALQTP
jgi:nicotinamide-nucleotide amidase